MKKILELILAVLISTFIFPLGFIFNIFLIGNFKKFIRYYWDISKQVVEVLLYACEQIAIIFDILGNVIAGGMFIFLFTVKIEDAKITWYKGPTYFNKSGWTISASTGHLLIIGKMNKFGRGFSRFLSFALAEKKHCLNAYYFKIYKQNYNKIK